MLTLFVFTSEIGVQYEEKNVSKDALLAGSDTTGNAASFLLYNIAANPKVNNNVSQLWLRSRKKDRPQNKYFINILCDPLQKICSYWIM